MTLLMESFVSTEGILTHLEENDSHVVQSALESLNELIPYNWAEIADKLSKIEELSEKTEEPYAKLASLLASKIFYHIQSYEDALNHALSAGEYFQIDESTPYVQKLTEQCIDSYRSYAQAQYAFDKGVTSKEPEKIDNRMIEIVERMLKKSNEKGENKEALGIALELRRMDHVLKAIRSNENPSDMIDHCFHLCETVVSSKIFRGEVLVELANLYLLQTNVNYSNLCRCYFYLGQPEEISRVIWGLCDKKEEGMAYQVAFDLTEYQNERFQRAVFDHIPKPPRSQRQEDGTTTTTTTGVAKKPVPSSANEGDSQTAGDNEATTTTTGVKEEEEREEWKEEKVKEWETLKSILLGIGVIGLELDFLYRNNNSDQLILKEIKEAIPERDSVRNNALVCCNGMMHTGTTIDQFLRDNLEWMSRSAHWAKLTSVATLGMIHKHHTKASMTILERYLPGSGGGPYQEGGSLYALGLIHCGDSNPQSSNKIREFILQQMIQASNEILQHGSCLGLGLAALGSQEERYMTAVKDILYNDRAVPGEAAGMALGMLQAGCNVRDETEVNTVNRWYQEMLAYAHETQHEKIIRGLVIGIALMHYNFEEKADPVIDTLLGDDDETIRYGGCFTIGLAYACTANNHAISRLLHLAVSDVSNDVRRAAVTNIGFVLANKPEQVPTVVQLLSHSYNSHVRYGAAAAIGIACAGTGNPQGVAIIRTMAQEDPVDFVKQAAMISLGMLLQQHNSNETPSIQSIRNQVFMKAIQNKRESVLTQTGAIYGLGILDACGRNAIISLCSQPPTQTKKMTAILGMAVFWQHWFWFPLVPFISLCFEPTMIMALNPHLRMPKLLFRSNAPPSLYAYPQPLKHEHSNTNQTLQKAVLSITAKQKARDVKKDKVKRQLSQGGDADADADTDADAGVDVDMSDATTSATDAGKDKDKKEEVTEPVTSNTTDVVDPETNKEKEKEKEKEATFQLLENPARVTLNQRKCMSWEDTRYQPVRKNNNDGKLYGIIIVEDSSPDKPLELVETKKLDDKGVHGNEPTPPKAFKYLGP